MQSQTTPRRMKRNKGNESGNKWNDVARTFRSLSLILFIIAAFASVSFAASASSTLTTTLCTLYKDLNSIIPVVAFVLFILSGVAYAAGQFFGAETRARAITWSMSMLTGAIIGLLITQFASLIITNLMGSGSTISTLCPGA